MSVHPSEPFVPRVVDDPDEEQLLALDHQSVELRSSGKSYASIAKALGLTGARQAHEAFTRGLRRRPPSERATLRDAESTRLQSLAEKTKVRTDLAADQIAKRLRAIERMRQTVMMD